MRQKENKMTFKEKLVILRKTRGITQDEFASAVGVSRQAVYKWECGQSYPEVPKLLEIKLLFGISIDNLLDDTFEIALPEKKKRKRLSKEAMRRIEESVESTESREDITNATRVSEITRAAFYEEPSVTEISGEPEVIEPAEEPVLEVEEEPIIDVEEENLVRAPEVVEAVIAEEAVPAYAVAELVAEDVAEESVTEPQEVPAVETLKEDPTEEEPAAPEKKVGFFGRLFGKK